MIFYFTATGNSLAVAKELDTDLYSIPQELNKTGELSYKSETIGIVCPVYTGLMPRIVRRFLKRAQFNCEYFYIILTYGMNPSVAEKEAVDYGGHVGVRVDYAASIKMVDNFLFAFDMNEQKAIDKEIPAQLTEIKENLKARKTGFRIPTPENEKAFSMGSERNCRWPEMTDGSQITILSDKCIGCGICTKVCPVGNFRLVNKKSSRILDYCEFCLACAHACPAKAITLSVQDKNPDARYRNPDVKLTEIINANNIR